MFRKRCVQGALILLFLAGCGGDDSDHAQIGIGGAWIAAMHYTNDSCPELVGTDRTEPFLVTQNGADIVITSAVFHHDRAISDISGSYSENTLNAGAVGAIVSPDGMTMNGTYTYTPYPEGCSYSLVFSAAKQPFTMNISGLWKTTYTVTYISPESSTMCFDAFPPGQPVAGDDLYFVQKDNLITDFGPFSYISKRGIIAGDLFVTIATHTASTPGYLYMKGTISADGLQVTGVRRQADMLCDIRSNMSLMRY